MRLWTVILMLGSCMAISSGDFTVPATGSKFIDDKLTWIFSTDTSTNTIVMHAKFMQYGYFSILFRDQMSNVSLFLFRETSI